MNDITYLRRMADSDVGRAAVDDLGRAMEERDPIAFDVIRELVKKPGVDPNVRAALLLQLVSMPSKDVERVLVDALSGEQPNVVRIRACNALGQIGTESALPILEKIAEDTAGPLKEQAAFAHVLASHRLRRPSRLLDALTRGERAPITGSALAFASTVLATHERTEVFAHLRQGHWNIAPVGHHGTAINCTGRSWAVVFSDLVADEGASSVLHSAPVVMGVVMRKSEEHDRWSIARILLGGPREKGRVYIFAFRTDGRVDLRGEGSVEERLVDLHAVKRAGALALSARAYWNGSNVTIAGIASVVRYPGLVPARHRSVEGAAG